MRATISWAGALASAMLFASSASAQYSPVTGQYHSPVTWAPLGYAPDACNSGFYLSCPNGQTLGPNYCLRPPFEPFQGVRPNVTFLPGGKFNIQPPPQAQPSGPPPAQYPYHPYARSPRDFFMFRENMEEENRRQIRPTLLP